LSALVRCFEGKGSFTVFGAAAEGAAVDGGAAESVATEDDSATPLFCVATEVWLSERPPEEIFCSIPCSPLRAASVVVVLGPQELDIEFGTNDLTPAWMALNALDLMEG
jgi:hypothetical protein